MKTQREALQRAFKRGRVDLRNADEVRAQGNQYLIACEQSGCAPSLMGFAVALGLSRARIYKFCAEHPTSETANYISAFQSAVASILAECSLTRALDNSTSIFLLKNSGQELADKVEIAAIATTVNPLGEVVSAEEIAEKYKLLPD